MVLHPLECVDDHCACVFDALVRTVEYVPPCPACAGPRERHNAVQRVKWTSGGTRVEVYDAWCPACDVVETGVESAAREAIYHLPPCETCGGPTRIISLPPAVTWDVAPVVVYRAPDGSFRYPGDADGVSAAQYKRLGYDRVELKGFGAVRQFERRANQHESSRAAIVAENRDRGRQMQESATRGELFRQMKTMSNLGRDVARAAIATGNARPAIRAHDAGIRVEVYSDDRSSREAARDSRGQRRRD